MNEFVPPDASIQRSLRQELVSKHGTFCQKCGLDSDHLHVHHLIPRAAGGSDDMSNVALLCASCHGKADAVVGVIGNRKRPLRSQVVSAITPKQESNEVRSDLMFLNAIDRQGNIYVPAKVRKLLKRRGDIDKLFMVTIEKRE